MKIWQKIILGFISVIVIMIIVDSSALMNNIRIIDEVENLERSKRVELTQSNKVAFLIQRIKSNVRELFLEIEHGERKDEIMRAGKLINTLSPELLETIQMMREAILIGYSLAETEEDQEDELEEIAMIDSMNALATAFTSDIQEIFKLLDKNEIEEADEFFEDHAEPMSREMQNTISGIVEEAEKEVAWAIRQLNVKVEQSMKLGIYLTVLSILLSIAIGLFIAKSISGPLHKLIYGTKEIGKGNLETRVKLDTKGELQLLADSFNNMTKELKDRITAINKLNKELEESNQTKDKYFSIIAHDLKNPFNVILGFTDLLVRKYDTMDNDKRLRIIKQLNDTSKIIYGLLDNLLTWARSQSGKIELFPKNLGLNTMIVRSIASYSGNAKQKKISISNDVPDDITVYADEFTLTVAINNAISNAIKFTPECGFVTLSAKKTDKDIELSISDSGTGMSQEIIKNLLQSKQIASSPGTKEEKGTGLGLMLIKDFISRNGGRLFIDSKPGKGTEIRFLLPGKHT
ncbi:MAG: HAMP domain-containing sensor histidine kinase [Bacteroidales bacterium]|jgi:signal transduction histidine kinase